MGLIYRGEYGTPGCVELELESLDATTSQGIVRNAFPIGGGCLWFTDAEPGSEWILARGQALRQTDYPQLYALWGVLHGGGTDNGLTTFSAPDLRQRFPLGKAASGTGSTFGASGGTIDHTHSTPDHAHTASTDSTGAHTHDVTITSSDVQLGSGEPAGAPNTYTTDSQGAHTHTVTVDSDGASTSGTGNPPYLVVNFAIRAR